MEFNLNGLHQGFTAVHQFQFYTSYHGQTNKVHNHNRMLKDRWGHAIVHPVLKHVYAKHGTPHDIISDQVRFFISKFWSSLCLLLNITANLLTAYHPKTDRQTECANQILEKYVCLYINYQQDNWVSFLLLVEFAYNNMLGSRTALTQLSL